MYQREMVLYTDRRSLRCWRAKRFLQRHGYQFKASDTSGDSGLLTEVSDALRNKMTLPYVFVDHRPVGNFGVIKTLSRSGGLEHLLRDNL